MPHTKKKICFVTGSRADYGLLKHLMRLIASDKYFELIVVVTGSHLSKKFGLTYKEIEEDGFKIDLKIDLEIFGDQPEDIAHSTAISVKGFSNAYLTLKPDLVCLLGDRYELLGAAISSMYHDIPIAHIHGGEVTSGAFDENIRHALTKFSHLHFVANQVYCDRVMQLGENPANIYTVGGLGVDAISRIDLISKEELEVNLNIKFLDKNLLVTFHPVTHEKASTEIQMNELLRALSLRDESFIIFTMPNADPSNFRIIEMINEFIGKRNNACLFNSLGQLKYLSCLSIVDAVVGNSSSGILEAPFLKKASINIGTRQDGRLKASSVIDCEPTFQSIDRAIEYSYTESFRNSLKSTQSLYGDGGAAINIVNIIKNTDLNNLLKKSFFDVNLKK